jgi:hypothetical protein
MKFPLWTLPVVVVLFVAIRISVSRTFRSIERRRKGKGRIESIPFWIKGFWALLALAVLILVVWAPRNANPNMPNPSANPAPPAAKP